jgi:hypothetical protein
MFNKFNVKEENIREGAKIANDQEGKKGEKRKSVKYNQHGQFFLTLSFSHSLITSVSFK